MGVVYKATHVPTGIPIAIKMMRREPATSRAHSLFLNEITQASKLNHTNIASIFDYGETTAEDANTSKNIHPEQPYIVMELARRGSLDMLDDVLVWQDLYGIIQSLLKALAHAHARGILHRDIKPGNILLGSPDDLRPSIKLTDFGLALTHSDGISPETGLRIVGTPEYMAPEQIEGLWREQVPATDLYALGCVAFELATGWPPFTGSSPKEVALGHLSSPLPPLRAMTALPEGFEDWINRMLAKEPSDRFQCAADAAYALSNVHAGAEIDATVAGPRRAKSASPTWTFMDIDLPRRTERPDDSGPAVHPEDSPPLTEDWRTVAQQPEGFPLSGATMSLVGIKHSHMVGRKTERDMLWSNLYEVARSGYPRGVVIKGTAGIGKRQMVEWLCHTAHEAGMATSLTAHHQNMKGPMHGLEHMFASFMHTRGLNGSEVFKRSDTVLKRFGVEDPYDRESMGRALLAASGAVSSPETIPLGSLQERLALFERLLQHLTQHRPLILHISEGQWASEGLQLAIRLLAERPRPLPVLIIVTCDQTLLQQRPQESQHLDAISASEMVEILTLDPLHADDARTLIETTLQVEPRLARQIQNRCAGSPVFAVQLVEGLVERGLLEPSAKGFRLKEGTTFSVPESIQELWIDRVTTCLAGMPPAATEAIRIAAALGVDVKQEEWEATCKALQIDIPNLLITRLARADLIDTAEDRWSFTHGLLRTAIAQESHTEWPRINLACANMLAGRTPIQGINQRIGQHLLEAGELENALDYLMRGVSECHAQGTLYEQLNLLDAYQETLSRLDVPESDIRWGQLWIERITVENDLQRFDLAIPLATKLCDSALRHKWTRLQAKAYKLRGIVATTTNEYSEADAMFARAQSLVMEGDLYEQAAIQRHWGLLLRRLGRPVESIEKLQTAVDTFREQGALRWVAYTLFNQAEVQQVLFNDHQEAVSLLNEAQSIFEAEKYNLGLADCTNGLGEIHRAMGNLANAEEAYIASAAAFKRAGVDMAVVPLANQGLLMLERGQFDKAYALFEEVRDSMKGTNWAGLMPFINAGLLEIAGAQAKWNEWDSHEEALRASLERTPMAERDLAAPVERAGDFAQVEGENERARRAWQLAQEIWATLGENDRSDRLLRRLNKTST